MTKTGTAKSANRWLDVQIVILTLTMTLSLFLWNLFAGGNRPSNSAAAANLQGLNAVAVAPSQPRVRILLGGAAPQIQVPSVSRGSSQAPAPVTITGSSR
jgi:hypothetical protein